MKNEIKRIKIISEFYKQRNLLTKPIHPLISLVDYSEIKHSSAYNHVNWIQDFYVIGLKRNLNAKLRYGQQAYDFDEGIMSFLAPGQVLNVIIDDNEPRNKATGYLLLIHPDFIWNTTLVKTIKKYDFFSYAINEALFLSDKEENILLDILLNIKGEIEANLDDFSQNIIISQIELLLNYSERFYKRQFITRKKSNHKILENLEIFLDDYFQSDKIVNQGLPTVNLIGEHLNLSTKYLSNMLKTLTGSSTKQHVQNKLIEIAKEKLTTTNMSVSEIAYELGFEHSQSFSKLFKRKTQISPLEFRSSFN